MAGSTTHSKPAATHLQGAGCNGFCPKFGVWGVVVQERMNGVESRHRNRAAQESAAIFEDMVMGNENGRKHCLRFKMDMQAPNKALRDPVAYRCNLTPHWRTKSDYKVPPATGQGQGHSQLCLRPI